jgi:hypothetical protein
VEQGYMINDIIGLMMTSRWQYNPDDIPYMIHHVGTIIYMTLVSTLNAVIFLSFHGLNNFVSMFIVQARHVGAGHMSAMTLMFTGEVTNPFQNIHSITKFWIQMEKAGPLLRNIHIYNEFLYAVIYSVVRLLIGPIQILHITYALLFTRQGRENIPLWVSLLWIVIIWGLILGSLPWSFEALSMAMDGFNLKYDENFNYCIANEVCLYTS